MTHSMLKYRYTRSLPNLVEVDPNVLVGLIVSIVGIAVGAGVAYGKLVARVHHLESNPLLSAWKQLQNRQAIDAIEKLLDDWREKK